ncbi:TPA_asm: hypothetical protein GZO62_01435 [Listeria monocytogenes]|uniref:Uncharacterized protein n=2 Tax=Listeria TaxID=1637 RepID=A0A3R0UVT3_LISMN|nr:hypothetical protein [Listeria monocytogenes]EFS00376.1 hypothetical protein NT03LS_1453 [Listeria seeligeri FSL N1-067]ATL51238.1 hypothetical protein CRD57_06495 [Listeria monocytogenes]ATL54266.1 hypothetical protein CRD58_06715 [Listeria monocytogenes]AVU80152.1 hypothetical protein C0Z03_06725 [Listeria monocytogenes]EAC2264932.1 hypothetical protein [Listeria monocytogenes]
MESYVQITNESAIKMILEGRYNELWYECNTRILPCKEYRLELKKVPTYKFFVKSSVTLKEE